MGMHDTGSVRSKMILMAVATTIVALLSAAVAMIVVDVRTFQKVWVDDLTTQADIVADVAAPAVSFNDTAAAARSLGVLRVRPQILSGAIYTNSGQRFATYAKTGAETRFPARPEAAGYRIEQGNWWCSARSSKMASRSAPSTCARASACSTACSATAPSSAA